ncbi:MAG: hypothetical protein VX278_15420 [Myxococcota bacterium]|nr:hypothetical protein [Myxococcota bacterium]
MHEPTEQFHPPFSASCNMLRRLRKIFHKSPSPSKIPPKPFKTVKALSDWQPRYPKLNLRKGIHPTLNKAIASKDPKRFITTIGRDLYSFPLFDPSTHQDFNDEIRGLLDWIELHQVSTSAPNSMHEYGLILSDLHWEEQLQEIRIDIITPLAAHLFPELDGRTLDSQHSFVVDYGYGRDTDLGFHVDNSEVTLNVCLGDQFSGSELYFQGRRCPQHRQTLHHPDEHISVQHQPGIAILHAGAHRHGTHPIRSGSRRNLIMWCASSTYRAKEESCEEWCGAHQKAIF